MIAELIIAKNKWRNLFTHFFIFGKTWHKTVKRFERWRYDEEKIKKDSSDFAKNMMLTSAWMLALIASALTFISSRKIVAGIKQARYDDVKIRTAPVFRSTNQLA